MSRGRRILQWPIISSYLAYRFSQIHHGDSVKLTGKLIQCRTRNQAENNSNPEFFASFFQNKKVLSVLVDVCILSSTDKVCEKKKNIGLLIDFFRQVSFLAARTKKFDPFRFILDFKKNFGYS